MQEERTIGDRTLLELRDSDHHIPWKVRFNLGNSSRQITQCRNSIQGKVLLTDELGTHIYLCSNENTIVLKLYLPQYWDYFNLNDVYLQVMYVSERTCW